MDKRLNIFVGYDGAVEPVAFFTFCQSVIEHSSIPVSFTPLALSTLKGYKEKHVDGSNAFIYSRFLVPSLCDYKGTAVFFDGDMLCTGDVAELLKYPEQEPEKAVWVVKHNYKTKHPIKYLGAKNEDYPRKNWSSVILWNCQHWQNKKLTPDLVMESTGSYLHRFSWLEDRFIGTLPSEWNHLVDEFEFSPNAKLVHFTLGTPCFKDYQYCGYSNEWWETYQRMIYPLTGDNKISNL
jgi:lipopolysaccharide biosynthesis glycosyltransferase